jgi:hypothetical protein
VRGVLSNTMKETLSAWLLSYTKKETWNAWCDCFPFHLSY